LCWKGLCQLRCVAFELHRFVFVVIGTQCPVDTAYGAVCRRQARGRTSPYVCVRQSTATYGTVRRRRILQMLNYMLLTVVVNGYNCVAVRHRRQRNACILRPSTYHERSVCVNAAAEINVLDYSVVVRQRTA